MKTVNFGMIFEDDVEKGGSGSGNFGHEGRPGEVGGSGDGEGGDGGDKKEEGGKVLGKPGDFTVSARAKALEETNKPESTGTRDQSKPYNVTYQGQTFKGLKMHPRYQVQQLRRMAKSALESGDNVRAKAATNLMLAMNREHNLGY